MRHYEIVILIHPDQSNQVRGMVDRYRALIQQGQGIVHRFEDWGRRQLAYSIEKVHKAHYLLFNIEANSQVLQELENAFRYNDAVIRNLIIRVNKAITEPSSMLKALEKSKNSKKEKSSELEHIDVTSPEEIQESN